MCTAMRIREARRCWWYFIRRPRWSLVPIKPIPPAPQSACRVLAHGSGRPAYSALRALQSSPLRCCRALFGHRPAWPQVVDGSFWQETCCAFDGSRAFTGVLTLPPSLLQTLWFRHAARRLLAAESRGPRTSASACLSAGRRWALDSPRPCGTMVSLVCDVKAGDHSWAVARRAGNCSGAQTAIAWKDCCHGGLGTS